MKLTKRIMIGPDVALERGLWAVLEFWKKYRDTHTGPYHSVIFSWGEPGTTDEEGIVVYQTKTSIIARRNFRAGSIQEGKT